MWSTNQVCRWHLTYLLTSFSLAHQLGIIEIPAGFTIAMSCVMGNRLILNVRLLKREMEANMEHREKSMVHFPFTYAVGSQSGVVFATNANPNSNTNSTPNTLPTIVRGDLELQEIRK